MGEPNRHNHQKDIFLRAIEIPSPATRADFVAAACEGDAALRQRVEAMLEAHAAPDSFLEKPAAALDVTMDAPDPRSAPGAPLRDPSPAPEGPGTRIGPYKLLEQIGEGGMGVVYVAEQLEPVRRRVALKIIKPGMDSRAVLARFEAERQALALMDHPNIAKVHDAGATPDGRPYFVMELVKGTPVTKFCDERRLPTAERLRLFVSVCQAIQHAHQKGVIHRDIKPSNVLVALYDDKPVPKVIDFGVAKAAGSPLDPLAEKLTDKTMYTGFGSVIGTPEYMSPEQAAFNQLDIDTRSDVYSLGVLLYEMLTGTTPVDRSRLRQAALLEVLRVVREEEPPRPSTRLSTAATAATIGATTGARGEGPDKLAKLAREVRGELDWIVMKSLEKRRDRRYDSAAALGRDVERFLNHELVEARPPTAAYRLRKLVERNRRAVLAGCLVLLALLAGVVGTTVGMVRAHRAQGRAVKAMLAAEASERDAKSQALSSDTARHALLMAQSMRCWEAGDVGEATRFLDAVAPPYRRTWEYHFLRGACERKFRPFALPEDESRTAWPLPSPGGRWLAAQTQFTGEPETLRVLDAQTGRERFRFFAPSSSLDFSHDGRWVAAAGNVGAADARVGKVKVFDLATGRERLTLPDLPGGVFDVTVTADGTRLVLGGRDKVLVNDSATGKVLRTFDLPGPAGRVVSSRDGKRLAAYSILGGSAGAGRLLVWDQSDGRQLLSRELRVSAYGSGAMAFSPDERQLVLSLPNDRVELWDVEAGQTRWTTDQVRGQFIGADFCPDGRHVVCNGADKVFVLDAATGKVDRSFRAGGSHGFDRGTPLDWWGVNCLPDGQHVVTATGVWDLGDVRLEQFTAKDSSGEDASEVNHANGVTGSAAFSGDGSRVLACAGTLSPDQGPVQELVRWDARTGQQVLPVTRWKRSRVHTLAFARGGRRIVLGCGDGAMPVYDTETGRELICLAAPADPPNHVDERHVAISDDGARVALSYGKQVTTWDVASGAKLQTFPDWPEGVGEVAISCDGGLVAAASSPLGSAGMENRPKEARVVIWDAATGRQLCSCAMPAGGARQEVTCLAFSPDRRRLVAGQRYGTVTVWDVRDGRPLHALRGHTNSVISLAFSPGGDRLATGGLDRTVRLWDMETGQEVLAIKTPDRVLGLAFSPDGSRLAACVGYKTVTVWAAP